MLLFFRGGFLEDFFLPVRFFLPVVFLLAAVFLLTFFFTVFLRDVVFLVAIYDKVISVFDTDTFFK